MVEMGMYAVEFRRGLFWNVKASLLGTGFGAIVTFVNLILYKSCIGIILMMRSVLHTTHMSYNQDFLHNLMHMNSLLRKTVGTILNYTRESLIHANLHHSSYDRILGCKKEYFKEVCVRAQPTYSLDPNPESLIP